MFNCNLCLPAPTFIMEYEICLIRLSFSDACLNHLCHNVLSLFYTWYILLHPFNHIGLIGNVTKPCKKEKQGNLVAF